MSSDLTFLTNEQGNTLRERFQVLLGDNTRCFDVLVGYFFVSGFHQLYPSLEKTEKIRILVGLRTDSSTVDLLRQAKDEQGQHNFHSQAEAKEVTEKDIAQELATYGMPGIAVYSATKHAVKGLTEALSIEFRRHGVRAADVLPGLIDTAILPPGTAERAPKEGMFRLIPPIEVAKVVWEAYNSDKLHWYVPPEIAVIGAFRRGTTFAPVGATLFPSKKLVNQTFNPEFPF